MPRQSITLTKPNDEWLLLQASNGEYSNKSDVINNLIRQARQDSDHLAWVRAALIEGEASKTSPIDPEKIKLEVKQTLRANGTL